MSLECRDSAKEREVAQLKAAYDDAKEGFELLKVIAMAVVYWHVFVTCNAL
jgi:hypothetical protein